MPAGFTFQHQVSMPSVRQPVTRVIVPDRYGIDRTYPVNAQTLYNVRSIVSDPNASTGPQQPAPYAPNPSQQASAQQSTASLASATSQFSSQSSLQSNVAQAAPYNQPAFR